MQRDGARESAWQIGKDDFQPKTGSLYNSYDIIIAGGGLSGVLTGLKMQEQGKKCLVLEAHSIGFGTTGGSSAHLNTFFDTPYYQVQKDFGDEAANDLAAAAKQALQSIFHNASRFEIDCDLDQKDGYIFALDEMQADELEKVIEGSVACGVEMLRINDNVFPIPYQKIAIVPKQAQFDPAKYLFGIAKAFEAAGGHIVINTQVTDVKEEDGRVFVTADAQTFNAGKFLWATHVPPGVNMLHFTTAPYRSYVMGFELGEDDYPDALGYDLMDPYHFYRCHVINGKNCLLVGGEDHKTAHEENPENCFRSLEAYAKQFWDIKSTVCKWSSQYYEPADGLPYIGELPGMSKNIYCATGYSGNGVIYAHIAAETLSAALNETETNLTKLFKPSRVKPVAAFTNLIKEGADVVKELVTAPFSGDKLKEFSELAAGEAKVVKHDGKKIALYKDEANKLHAINPSCTHIHCTVAWNDVEKSWDCPCHGARFTCDGKVLNAPAVKNLDKIQIQ